jgi:hypothetical protein
LINDLVEMVYGYYYNLHIPNPKGVRINFPMISEINDECYEAELRNCVAEEYGDLNRMKIDRIYSLSIEELYAWAEHVTHLFLYDWEEYYDVSVDCFTHLLATLFPNVAKEDAEVSDDIEFVKF